MSGTVLRKGTPEHWCDPSAHADSVLDTVWRCDCGLVWTYDRMPIRLIEVILDKGSGDLVWRRRSKRFARQWSDR